MSQMSVQITAPQGAPPEVPRTFQVSGTISIQLDPGHSLVSRSVTVYFGDRRPGINATLLNASWTCTGQPSDSVPAGGQFVIEVSAQATARFFHGPGDPDIEFISAPHVTKTVRLQNPAPILSIDAFSPEVRTAQLPVAFTLAGGAPDADNNVLAVHCTLDTGQRELAQNVSGSWSRWQKTYSLGEGLHRFVVHVLDAGGNQSEQTAFLNVIHTNAPADSVTESITSWTRLEPQGRDASMGWRPIAPQRRDTNLRRSASARAFDPLWMLARQWQVGEFQGIDAGTPVQARARATSALLSRCHLGELGAAAQGAQYDPHAMPLEMLAERRRMRATTAGGTNMLRLSVEAGLHFLRMLEAQSLTRSYRAGFIARFALRAPSSQVLDTLDASTRQFLGTMADRALDARLLVVMLRAAGGAGQLVSDAALQIATADRPKVQQCAVDWLAWYDGLFAEPGAAAGDAWNAARMEYALSVSANLSAQSAEVVTLTAGEFANGCLDWSSFDVNTEFGLGAAGDRTLTTITETVIPAPITFRGAPAVRFWELEDSTVAYGLVPVGPTDLAHLMVIEYAGSYGNDWFVVPMSLPVGSMTRVDSLVVTDTFGERSLLKPIGAAGIPAHWSMWQQSLLRRAGDATSNAARTNLFFLPPVLGSVLDGAPLEHVLFLRDEMANVAWAIEKEIEGPLEQALPRAGGKPAPAAPANGMPRYQLASEVPENWLPFLPVQTRNAQGRVISRLKRGALLQPNATRGVPTALSETLNAASPLLLFDEEVPREGVRVTRSRRMSRWIDGSTWVWTAYRKEVGRGEGSSGLEFDQLLGG